MLRNIYPSSQKMFLPVLMFRRPLSLAVFHQPFHARLESRPIVGLSGKILLFVDAAAKIPAQIAGLVEKDGFVGEGALAGHGGTDAADGLGAGRVDEPLHIAHDVVILAAA